MLGALHLYRSIVNQRLWQHGAAGLSTATGAFPHPASLVVSDTAPSATSLIPPHEVEEGDGYTLLCCQTDYSQIVTKCLTSYVYHLAAMPTKLLTFIGMMLLNR